MVVCNFFLQGRCRYGDRCWNEHPGRGGGDGRGGGGGRGGRQYQQPQQSYQGNRGGWNTQSDRYTSGTQSHNVYKWEAQGSNRDGGKTNFGSQSAQTRNLNPKNTSVSEFSFSNNKFSALSSAQDGDNQRDEEADTIDSIVNDMESWESSGQWMLSAYSFSKEKPNISGFEDISPEELRLECYRCRADGNVQNYINAVQQLILKWRNRLNELKNSTSVKAALVSELNKPVGETKPAFASGGQPAPTFGSASFPTSTAAKSSVSDFSFKPQSDFSNSTGGGFGSFGDSTTTPGPVVFASAPATHVSAGFGSTSSSASLQFGFGSAAPSGFGGPGFADFAAPQTNIVAPSAPSVTSGFGTLHSTAASSTTFGSVAANAGSSILGPPPGQSITSFGGNIPKAATTILPSMLFTPLNELSAEELKQFQAKKFTLGRIPLKPPPAELIM